MRTLSTTIILRENCLWFIEIDRIASLALQTRHGLAETGVAVADPSGYVMIDGDGQTVGALELTGGATRRAILPNNAAQRKAALFAAITLALLWDPGDVG